MQLLESAQLMLRKLSSELSASGTLWFSMMRVWWGVRLSVAGEMGMGRILCWEGIAWVHSLRHPKTFSVLEDTLINTVHRAERVLLNTSNRWNCQQSDIGRSLLDTPCTTLRSCSCWCLRDTAQHTDCQRETAEYRSHMISTLKADRQRRSRMGFSKINKHLCHSCRQV